MNHAKLLFVHGFDERTAYEAELKGYYGNAVAQLPTGRNFRVCFYDPIRLAQDLERGQESGDNYIAEPGLIVIPRVNAHYMEQSIQRLAGEGYFDHMLPMK